MVCGVLTWWELEIGSDSVICHFSVVHVGTSIAVLE